MSAVIGCAVLVAALGNGGCGRTSEADIERARREVELGSTLYRDEGNTAAAIEHLRTALELDPENYDAYTLLGMIHLGQSNFASAESEFQRAIELMTEQDAPGHKIATARNFLGAVYMAQGRWEDAVTPLEAAANDELFREPHVAWGNLGFSYLQLGRHQEAIAALTRSVQLGPRFCLGYYWLGLAYYQTEALEEAEGAMVQAIEADPTCTTSPRLQNAWRVRGEVRARLGLRDDALADFERCVELGPNSPDGRACQRTLDQAQ